jgi:hypothetical protein
VWHASCGRPEKNCSGELGWLGMLQIGIRASGSNTRLLRARTSVNREDSLSQILYICANLGKNGGNI